MSKERPVDMAYNTQSEGVGELCYTIKLIFCQTSTHSWLTKTRWYTSVIL